MTLSEVLEEAARRKVRLEVQGDGICVTPAAQLSAELREGIRQHKAELLALLRSQSPKAAPAVDKPPAPKSPAPVVVASPAPANAKPTPPAAAQGPEIKCYKCTWQPPAEPNCRHCAREREQWRRLGTRPVISACFNCRRLPPGSPDCPFCAAERRFVKMLGREHEGIITPYSDPQAVKEVLDRALGNNYGRARHW